MTRPGADQTTRLGRCVDGACDLVKETPLVKASNERQQQPQLSTPSLSRVPAVQTVQQQDAQKQPPGKVASAWKKLRTRMTRGPKAPSDPKQKVKTKKQPWLLQLFRGGQKPEAVQRPTRTRSFDEGNSNLATLQVSSEPYQLSQPGSSKISSQLLAYVASGSACSFIASFQDDMCHFSIPAFTSGTRLP